MNANLEIKAKCADRTRLKARAEKLTKSAGKPFEQVDIFFSTPRGRLKLRVLSHDEGELIYYERPDAAGPQVSSYHIARSVDPHALALVLEAALGIRGTVRKRRILYLLGDTRIHLDEVEGLGSYVELEVVMSPAHTVEQCTKTARDVMQKLGIREQDLLDSAYIDLLEKKLS